MFDAFVEVRDLLTPEAIADLRAPLEQAATAPETQIARAMLLAHAQGDDARFRHAYATYLDQPCRSEQLNALLEERAKRR